MDRPLVYLGAVPDIADNLNLGQSAMVGLGKLAEAVLGAATVVAGFAVSPTNPTSLSVNVAPGQIYQQEQLEATAISGLTVDTHPIIKQGVSLDTRTETFTVPTTIGMAWNILIQAAYADSDTDLELLAYQDPSNKDNIIYGPGGNGAKQNTVRAGVVNITLKTGTAATTGTQTTPSPDPGYIGLAVVTIAYGQTLITGANIAPYVGAPFLQTTLASAPGDVQSGKWTFGVDNGVQNALNVVLNPSTTVLTIGQQIAVRVKLNNTGAATAVINGQPAVQIVYRGAALTGNELKANQFTFLIFDGTYLQLVGASQAPPAQYQEAYYPVAGAFVYTVPPNVTRIKVTMRAGGASGGGVNKNNASASGGGGGEYREGTFSVVAGQAYNLTVGLGGAASTPGPNNGVAGGSSSFGSLLSAVGGSPGLGIASGFAAGGKNNTPGGTGGSGGDFSYPGEYGHSGFAFANAFKGAAVFNGGPGGGTWAVQNTFFSEGASQDGYGPGGGGSGASTLTNTATAGGKGCDGFVTVECVG